MTKEKIFYEILKWLYIHHGAFDSGEEWREAFVDYLEEILKKK